LAQSQNIALRATADQQSALPCCRCIPSC